MCYEANTGSVKSTASTTTQAEVEEPVDQETVGTVSSVASAATAAATIGICFTSSILSSTSQSAWALLNQYQLVLLLPYLRGYLTKEFIFFIRDFKFALFNFAFVDEIYVPYMTKGDTMWEYDQPDFVFAENDLESGSFIVNQLSLVKSLLIIMALHMVLLLIIKT